MEGCFCNLLLVNCTKENIIINSCDCLHLFRSIAVSSSHTRHTNPQLELHINNNCNSDLNLFL